MKGPLTRETAERVGGLGDALNREAETAFRSLPVEQQRIAKMLFRRITELGRATGEEEEDRPIRRPQAMTDLMKVTGASRQTFCEVISRFEERGILTLRNTDSGKKIDLPHEICA